MRVLITLECTQCGNRNYHSEKNKNKTTDRLQLKKYCPHCSKHTLHKETR